MSLNESNARARPSSNGAAREESLEAIARRRRSPFASPRVEVSREDECETTLIAARANSRRARIHLSTRVSLDPFARGDDARRST
jgi:hypothetical protein